MRPSLIGGVLLGVSLSACVLATSKESFVKTQLKRAAFDLNCKEDQVEVTELQSGTYSSVMGASGCGQKATYKYVQNLGWVSQTMQGPAPAQ